MNLLLELTLRGSAAALIILVFDRAFAGRISGPSRRLWWCFLPLAFLVPLHVAMLPALGHLPPLGNLRNQQQIEIPNGADAAPKIGTGGAALEVGIWLAGAFLYIAIVAIQTGRASRRWSGRRLSTDHSLLAVSYTHLVGRHVLERHHGLAGKDSDAHKRCLLYTSLRSTRR